MVKSTKMHIYHEKNYIYFKDNEQNILGYTNYDKGLWESIQDLNWGVNWGKANSNGKKKGYIGTGSSKLGKRNKLHQIVMAHWYGEETVDIAYSQKFIIEHMDNNPFDCTVENLSFAPNNVNIAKGQVYDVERREALESIAVNIYKDFESGKYQITIGFNKLSYIVIEERPISVTVMRLVYEDDYRRALMDAENILYEFKERKKLKLNNLNYIDMEYIPAYTIESEDGRVKTGVFEYDGKNYLILNQNSRLEKIRPNQKLY